MPILTSASVEVDGAEGLGLFDNDRLSRTVSVSSRLSEDEELLRLFVPDAKREVALPEESSAVERVLPVGGGRCGSEAILLILSQYF